MRSLEEPCWFVLSGSRAPLLLRGDGLLLLKQLRNDFIHFPPPPSWSQLQPDWRATAARELVHGTSTKHEDNQRENTYAVFLLIADNV